MIEVHEAVHGIAHILTFSFHCTSTVFAKFIQLARMIPAHSIHGEFTLERSLCVALGLVRDIPVLAAFVVGISTATFAYALEQSCL